jgi:hypothetical protein
VGRLPKLTPLTSDSLAVAARSLDTAGSLDRYLSQAHQ